MTTITRAGEKPASRDLTPTWAALLPAFLAVLEDGTPEGKRIARDELRRMAQAADYWNEHAKALGLPTDEEPAHG